MVNTTSPDNIPMWQLSDAASLTQESQTQGAAIQAAFNKRMRSTYVWPTSAERTAQTGMVQGSLGYQVDTRSEYKYNGSAWALALPYAQINGGSTVSPDSAFTAAASLTIDTSSSTDTTFVSASSNQVILVNPGVYSMTFVGRDVNSLGASGISQAMISTNSSASVAADRVAVGYFNGTILATAPLIYNTTSSNVSLYFFFYNQAGASRTFNSLIRLARLG